MITHLQDSEGNSVWRGTRVLAPTEQRARGGRRVWRYGTVVAMGTKYLRVAFDMDASRCTVERISADQVLRADH